MSYEIKTSKEWAKECKYIILDPDGWDRTNYNYSFNKEKIDLIEFQQRLAVSTIKLEEI